MSAAATTHESSGVRPRVTIVCRSFPPAYLRGGPGRSVAGMVESLGAEFDFSVVTWAFDEPQAPMMDVVTDQWLPAPGGQVRYLSAQRPSVRELARVLRATEPSLVVLNSLLDTRFSIVELLVLRAVRRCPVLLAPHGELSPGALAIKPTKKRWFLRAFRAGRLHRWVAWHATTELEAADIRREFGEVLVHVAPPLFGASDPRFRDSPPAAAAARGASDGEADTSLVFFSRIVPKKNLAGLLVALRAVRGPVSLTIAGPVEDEDYWQACQGLIAELPASIRVVVHGPVPADDVVSFLSAFDVFVLPTFGENFGHVVLEALMAGVPVVVGRDTPWQVVATEGAGWLCVPDDARALGELLQRFVELDDVQRATMRQAAVAVARSVTSDEGVHASRAMLTAAVRR